jgi:hypothetical protein
MSVLTFKLDADLSSVRDRYGEKLIYGWNFAEAFDKAMERSTALQTEEILAECTKKIEATGETVVELQRVRPIRDEVVDNLRNGGLEIEELSSFSRSYYSYRIQNKPSFDENEAYAKRFLLSKREFINNTTAQIVLFCLSEIEKTSTPVVSMNFDKTLSDEVIQELENGNLKVENKSSVFSKTYTYEFSPAKMEPVVSEETLQEKVEISVDE